MGVEKEKILHCVGQVSAPFLDADLHALRAIESMDIHSGDPVPGSQGDPLASQDFLELSFHLRLGYPLSDARHQEALKQKIEKALVAEIPSFKRTPFKINLTINSQIVSHRVQPNLTPIPGIKNILAVASGKGGVGKSTVAVNLALALQQAGARVGILDADIYGPSQPRMLGIQQRPVSEDNKHMQPLQRHGIQSMSMGYLVEEDTAMIWRGPMVSGALQQLLNETLWNDLDYLIVDLPPGTGDIQLTLAQKIPVSGALIVTTPQDIALLDARRALMMFRKVDVPVLGVIENMSGYVCPHCGDQSALFGSGGGERMSKEHQVPLLGHIPLDRRIREQADGGEPTVVAMPDHPLAICYRNIAIQASALLSCQPRVHQAPVGKVIIES